MSGIGSKSIIDFPTKLPMIVKPKSFTSKKLVVYLLNDINCREKLIIQKNFIKDKSYLKADNVVYNMINSISGTPYKINKELLDYLINIIC